MVIHLVRSLYRKYLYEIFVKNNNAKYSPMYIPSQKLLLPVIHIDLFKLFLLGHYDGRIASIRKVNVGEKSHC